MCHKQWHDRILLHIWFIQKWDSSSLSANCHLTFAAQTLGVSRIHYELTLATTEEQILQSVLAHSQTTV